MNAYHERQLLNTLNSAIDSVIASRVGFHGDTESAKVLWQRRPEIVSAVLRDLTADYRIERRHRDRKVINP
jgi:hypothetical protein